MCLRSRSLNSQRHLRRRLTRALIRILPRRRSPRRPYSSRTPRQAQPQECSIFSSLIYLSLGRGLVEPLPRLDLDRTEHPSKVRERRPVLCTVALRPEPRTSETLAQQLAGLVAKIREGVRKCFHWPEGGELKTSGYVLLPVVTAASVLKSFPFSVTYRPARRLHCRSLD